MRTSDRHGTGKLNFQARAVSAVSGRGQVKLVTSPPESTVRERNLCPEIPTFHPCSGSAGRLRVGLVASA